ncbi:CDGSH iron-sulfur domain-containing protein [Algiphilus sp. NNCM1]|nr:CDGSH iron-sulfur domain-containing protein [Algiphilus acroporae]
MSDPDQATRQPLLVKPTAGEYRACGCGQSPVWPLCPASCERSEASPSFRVRRDGARVWLCRCGHSRRFPHCDGRHNRLPD